MIKPLRNYCLIELIEQEKEVGGFIVPDAVKERQAKGVVLNIGEPGIDLIEIIGYLQALEDYNEIKGKKVIFKRFGGEKIPGNDNQFLIKFDNILGVEIEN